MRLLCLAICLVVGVTVVNAGGDVWLKDLISPKGWNLGYGVVLKLNESKKGRNVPMMERLSLDLSIAKAAGLSLSKAKSDGVELDFYVEKNVFEGRGSKNNNRLMIPMMIGFKTAMAASIMFAIMKMLAMKAIFLAKAALIISIFVLLMKLKENKYPEIIEVEQHAPYQHYEPYYVEKQPQGYGHYGQYGNYGQSASYGQYGREAQPTNLYNDVVYAPSATADASSGYSESALPNGSGVVAENSKSLEKRRDKSMVKKYKPKMSSGTVLTVKKFSSIEN